MGFDKRTVIAQLLARPPFLRRSPMFIGGDLTDEFWFALVESLGGRAFSVGARRTGNAGAFETPEAGRNWPAAFRNRETEAEI